MSPPIGLRASGRLGVLLAALVLAAPAGAAPRRVEAIGAVPAGQGRHSAIQAALDEAVRKVVRSLLDLAEEEPLTTVSKLLGGSASDYTIRYRVLEDLGERRATLIDPASAEREYAVVVESTVDEDRIAAALRASGALAEAVSPGAEVERLRLIVEPADSYPALEGLERRLEEIGVQRVVPVSFAAGRAEYQLSTGRAPERLLAALLANPPAGTRLVPVSSSTDELRIRLDALPTPPGALPAD